MTLSPLGTTTGPAPLPVATGGDLPAEIDVAIVGGGIIGVAAALTLAERKVRVALFEKGIIAGEQSSRNWGWVRVNGRDLREIPLMLRASELWESMDERVGGDTGYRRCGIVYAARTPAQRERHERWVAQATRLGVDARILAVSDVAARAPGLNRHFVSGLFTPKDGRAEPQRATSMMAEASIRLGAGIFQRCAVRSIDMSGGRATGVVTEHGRVRAGAVIVAGGAWSRILLKGAGVTLPQLKVLSSVFRTAPVEAGIEPCMSFASFALRKRMDGGYTVASSAESLAQLTPDTLRFFLPFFPAYLAERKGMSLRFGRAFLDEALNWQPRNPDRASIFEAVRILDPKPHEPTLERVRAALNEALPVFGNVPTEQSWAGMIDTTPDAIPVISPVEARPGLFVGTGFAGHGFGIGPAAGELLADLATGRAAAGDWQAFRFSRFNDGSRLDLQHWL